MTAELISCVIPVFNGERYLGEALDSIRAQTYRPLEIIVADDGSTDGTAAVVARYGSDVVYLHQPNAGPAAARNLGLAAARGDFIAFLDADDHWPPGKLARQVACLHARPDLDLCVAHVQNFWMPEVAEEAGHMSEHRIARALPGYVPGTLLARRSVFDRVGEFNAAMAHGDPADWFLRATEIGVIGELLPDVLLYRRMHRDNRSRHHTVGSHDEYLRLLKAHLDRRRKKE